MAFQEQPGCEGQADATNDRADASSSSTAEQSVEAHSSEFKKELGLRDLVLTQILFIVGLGWVGVAAELGPAHIVFWLLAIILFYIPSAIVVTYLSRRMPLEGGLYQWAKLGFNNFTAFMVAWNLWLYAMVNTAMMGLLTATNLAYALGPRATWMATSDWFITVANVVCIGLLIFVSVVGLGLGKWVHNVGGIVMLLLFAALLVLPVVSLWRGTLAAYHPFAAARPAVNLYNLNILGKMGFGALGGFELVAILAGESRDPVRTIGRSVIIAAPIIALMFILGTSSVLAFVPPGKIDLISPIAQVLTLGFRSFGFIANIIAVVIILTQALILAQASFIFTATTRLPMVTGWDHLLPQWFSRIHPRFKTPINSIVFVGAVSLAISIAGSIGVGGQEAYQLLWNTSGILYGFSYLVMFAIPIVGLRHAQSRPAVWIKVAACSGFLMTLLYEVLSIFPIIEVRSWFEFTTKVTVVIAIHNLIGAAIYIDAARRNRLATEA